MARWKRRDQNERSRDGKTETKRTMVRDAERARGKRREEQ